MPYKEKPIPRTVRGWAKELEGVERFLSRARKRHTGALGKWYRAMRLYYEHRKSVLLEHQPKAVRGLEKGRVILRNGSLATRNPRPDRKRYAG